MPLMRCTEVNCSPRISTASIVLKTGIKLLNKDVLAGPILAMDAFQHKKPMTELPIPRYKMVMIIPLVQCNGPVK